MKATLNLGYDYTETDGQNIIQDSTQWIIQAGGGQQTLYSNSAKNQLLDFYDFEDIKSIESRVEVLGGYSWSLLQI